MFVRVASGQGGRVLAWGRYGDGQTNVPAGLSNVVAIAGGASHSLALQSDGRMSAWGNTYYSQSIAPPWLSNVVSIGSGMVSSLAVRSNGTVVVWGYDGTGLTNVPAEITNAIAAEAGYTHAAALLDDGRLRDWGAFYYSVPAPAWCRSNIISIASGPYHTAALRSDGRVLCWGANSEGTNVPPGLSNVVAVSAGQSHTLALLADGTATAWGSFYSPTGWTAAFVPSGISNLVQVGSGDNHCLALKRDGTVVAWGFTPEATAPIELSNVVMIACGTAHNLALLSGGPLYLPHRLPDRTGCSGGMSVFRVQPVGAAPFSYQWRFNGVGLPGQTDSTLILTNLKDSDSGAYSVSVRSASGDSLTDDARLEVLPFWITSDPRDRVQYAGGAVDFQVEALGSDLHYQWQWNGRDIPGATSSRLVLTNLSLERAGLYSVVVSNHFAARSSGSVRLGVVQVAGWGDNTYGQIELLPGLTNIVGLAAGSYHNLALRHDGSVLAWGQDTSGSTVVPSGLSNVLGIAAGAYHNLALLSNGTVTAWGKSDAGQTYVPASASNVVDIAAGGENSAALRRDGRVVTWGNAYLPASSSASNMVEVATIWDHCLALRADGKVLSWWNSFYHSSVPEWLTNVVGIAAGPGFDLALRDDGTVVAWGTAIQGQTNVPPGLSNVVAISAGCLALDAAGRVTWWGNTNDSQALPSDLPSLVAIASGKSHSLGLIGSGPPRLLKRLADRTVYGGATAYFRATATGARPLSYRWRRNGVDVPEGTNSWLALPNAQSAQAGLYSVVVSNSLGMIESETARLTIAPLFISAQPTNQVAYAGASATLAVGVEGAGPFTFQWLFNGLPVAGETNSALVIQNVQAEQAGLYSVVISNTFGAVTSQDMRLDLPWVAMWGRYSDGNQPLPTGLTNITAVAIGPNHSLALRSDGTVVGWGFYNWGASVVPTNLSNVVAIDAGSQHSLALLSDGTVSGWGRIDNIVLPPPASATNLAAIAAGGAHNLGLRRDGTVLAWGDNYYGSYGQTNVPAGLTNVVGVNAGFTHSLAIRADGTVAGWGRNLNGECSVPAGLSNVVAIAAGSAHSLALNSDGTVVCWGDNDFGQSDVPFHLTNVAAISAGSVGSLGLAAAGPACFRSRLCDRTLVSGQNAYFYAEVSGSRPLQFQWRLSGVDLPGQTNPILTLKGVLPLQDGMYSLAVSNRYGLTVSDAARLTILPVWIQSQPADQVRSAGGITTFTVSALGAAPLSYQWRHDGTNLSGATTSTLTLSNLQLSDSGLYSVAVSNSWGGTLSSSARLDVQPLIITASPVAFTGNSGAAASFTVGVGGVGPFAYQWLRDGVALPGATNSTLVLTNIQSAQAGAYSVIVSNRYGAVRSDAARAEISMVVAWGLYKSLFAGQTNLVAVAAGDTHSLALRRDGTVIGWGNHPQADVPFDLVDAVAVACGRNHSLALRSNGTVVAWGSNSKGQTNVPAGLSNVVAIAGGTSHSAALRADGTVVAWGDNTYGQTNLTAWVSNVVAIGAGENQTLALQADGKVVGDQRAYGANFEITNAVAVDGGWFYSLALEADGTVTEWDNNQVRTNVPAGLRSVVGIDAGFSHELALRADGTVAAWGANSYGQTTVPAGLSNVASVAAGNSYSLAMLHDGIPFLQTPMVSRTALAGDQALFYAPVAGACPLSLQWRFNGSDLPGATNAILRLTNIQPSQAGLYSLVASNFLGIITSPESRLTVLPSLILDQPRNAIASRGSGVSFSAGIASKEPVFFQWSFNGTAIPGATGSTFTLTNVQLEQSGSYAVTVNNRYGSISSQAALLEVGVIAVWGDNSYGQTNLRAGLQNIRAVSSKGYLCGALKEDGRVLVWGSSDPDLVNTVAGLTNVSALACGWHHILTLNPDGTVSASGYDTYGETAIPAGLSNVLAVAAGWNNSVALRTNGTVVCWGSQSAVPFGLSNVVAISSSGPNVLALQADGHLVAWGSGSYGQSSIPVGLSNLVSIAAGDNHFLALRDDGSVVAWGYDGDGATAAPAGISNAVAIAAGGRHSLAVLEDGAMVAWGRNTNGQAAIPTSVSNVVAAAAGYDHSMALLSAGKPLLRNAFADRTVLGGNHTYFFAEVAGALPVRYQWRFYGTNLPGATSRFLHLTNIAVAQAGPYSVRVSNAPGEATSMEGRLAVEPFRILAQPESRTLYAGGDATLGVGLEGNGRFAYQWRFWGTNLPGETGASLTLTNVQFEQSGPYSVVVSNPWGALASADAQLGVVPFIMTQPQSRTGYVGTATSLGINVSGVGLGFQWRFNGRDVAGQTNATLFFPDLQLSDAGSYSVLVSNAYGSAVSQPATLTVNLVTAWGGNIYSDPPLPMPAEFTNIVAVAQGQKHALGLCAEGGVVGWGNNDYGQINVPSPASSNVVAVAAGAAHSVALRADGSVVVWGGNEYGQRIVPANVSNVVAVACGANHTLALRANGTVVGWGKNLYGQVSVPVSLSNVVAVAAGDDHSVALRANGTVAAWGVNSYGVTNVPASLTNIVAIAAGGSHSLALRTSGIVTGWGMNSYGEATGPSWLSNVTAIACGSMHSLALRADGAVAAWGNYYYGQNVVPAGLSNVVAIAAGGNHNLALSGVGSPFVMTGFSDRLAGALDVVYFKGLASGRWPLSYQWQLDGQNIAGATTATLALPRLHPVQAGFYSLLASNTAGATTSRLARLVVGEVVGWGSYQTTGGTLPVTSPLGLTNVLAVSAGGNHALALRADRGVVAWGDNQFGQLAVPTSLQGACAAVAAGGYHSLALLTNGSVAGWGSNGYGQRSVPVGLSNVVAVAAGGLHSAALRADGRVVCWGDNSSGQTNQPAGLAQVAAVACGPSHTLALRDDGTVVAWGSGAQTNVPYSLSNIVAVACGAQHSLALRDDGRVVAWGLAPGTNVPAELSNVVAIAANSQYGFALQGDGRVAAWGGFNPPRIPDISGAIAITAGAGSLQGFALLGRGQPAIAVQPFATVTAPGGQARLTAFAAGTGLTYQWQFNGTDLVGATNATLVLAGTARSGNYRVVVTNAYGSAISSASSVTSLPLFDLSRTFAAADGLHLNVAGLSGFEPLLIYSSRDLVQWQPLLTNPPVIGAFEFIHSAATNEPLQFYRAAEGF